MKKHVFKVWSEWFRDQHESHPHLLVNVRGDYEYRNPDSVYIHSFERFESEEAAREFLEQRIAPADRDKWRLYMQIPTDPSKVAANRGGDRMDTWADVG